MEDLGRAMAGQDRMLMLGGGNPAHIPEVQAVWRDRMRALLDDGAAFDCMLANYDTPKGNAVFIDTMVSFLNRRCGWDLTRDNLAIMNGGQTALFCLMNMFSGPSADGVHRKIVFPLMPEYIGYADQGLADGGYRAYRPRIDLLDDRQFKYHVDFDALALGDDAGALCLSRPTNPTGNVLPDAELRQLVALAKSRDVPVIIDNAYGNPFPGILFGDALPVWDTHTILTFSLSKLGLPGTRTGIVVGPPEVIKMLESMNSVLSLASGNVGQALVTPLLANDDIVRLAEDVIRPFYRERSEQAQAWVRDSFPTQVDYRYHKSEGSMFLWLWFRDLPITTRELYERLKKRGVLIVPGSFFFFGLDAPWRHSDECLRMNYSHNMDDVRQAIRIMAEEVDRAYRDA